MRNGTSIFFVTELAGWHNFPIKDALTKGLHRADPDCQRRQRGRFCTIVVSQQGIRHPEHDLCPGRAGGRLRHDHGWQAGFGPPRPRGGIWPTTPSISTARAANAATMAAWKSIAPSSSCAKTSRSASERRVLHAHARRPEHCKDFRGGARGATRLRARSMRRSAGSWPSGSSTSSTSSTRA